MLPAVLASSFICSSFCFLLASSASLSCLASFADSFSLRFFSWRSRVLMAVIRSLRLRAMDSSSCVAAASRWLHCSEAALTPASPVKVLTLATHSVKAWWQ